MASHDDPTPHVHGYSGLLQQMVSEPAERRLCLVRNPCDLPIRYRLDPAVVDLIAFCKRIPLRCWSIWTRCRTTGSRDS